MVKPMKHCEKCKCDTERNAGGRCKPCANAISAAWRTANTCKLKARKAAYRAANKDKIKASSAAYNAVNRDKLNAASAAYRAANHDKVKAVSAAWNKANPERKKATHAAWSAANKEATRAYRASNRERKKTTDAAWAKANPERRKAINAAWREANPESKRISDHNRRALIIGSGGKLSKGLFGKLFALQRGKCPVCEDKLSDIKPRSPMDHIIALINGGANEDWNIQILCQPCNQHKYTKHPVEFMQSRGFLI